MSAQSVHLMSILRLLPGGREPIRGGGVSEGSAPEDIDAPEIDAVSHLVEGERD